MSVNKVILLGNVGKDPEVKILSENAQTVNKAASFTLATTEKYRDKVTGGMKENTEWHNVVAYRNAADIVERFVRKGSQLYIDGKIKTRSYTTSTGEKKYVTEIIAENIQLLGSPRREDSQQQAYAPAPQPAYAPAPQDESLDPQTDDLPF